MHTDHDMIIVGGGMVGASLACALADQGMRVAVVEAVPLRADSQPSYDERGIALSQGSARILQSLGLWDLISDKAPIKQIHVSDQGHMGVTRMDSRREGVEALGYVVIARTLGQALARRLEQLPSLELICPARVVGLHCSPEGANVRLEQEGKVRELSASLIVVADGGQSSSREQLGIASQVWEYDQSAVIANVSPQNDHQGVAFERFTRSGPLAMLPMTPEPDTGRPRCSLVWTRRNDEVEQTMALGPTEFLDKLEQTFGLRLGRLTRVGERHVYPLRLIRAREQVRARLAVIGNAAHTLHPLAGQGFNLGLRDVAVLAEVLVDGRGRGEDLGDENLLQRYAQWRKPDHNRVIAFTDGMVRLFSNPLAPVALARNLGLVGLDLLPPARSWLARQAMGLGGRLPRPARGLAL